MRPSPLHYSRPRRGSLLIFTVIFIGLLSLSVLPVVQFVNASARMAHDQRATDKAFYAAEGGIAKALSYIYGQGGGEVTGIYDQQFAVPKSSPAMPFGAGWMTLDEGVTIAASPRVGSKVSVWQDGGSGDWLIQSIGKAEGRKEMYRTITVTIGAGSFARYSFFNTASLSTMDGRRRWLASGETFNGPVHTNRHLFVYGVNGNPLTFNSDVTIVGEEAMSSNSSYQYVDYNGLKDTNASYIELPSDLSRLIAAAADGGLSLPADDPFEAAPPLGYADPVPGINNYRFEFQSNGRVDVTNLDAATWASANGVSYSPMNVALWDINGAIAVHDGNVFVSGTVSGRATIAAIANDADTGVYPYNSSTRTDGNLIVEGDIVYKSHPLDAGGGLDISEGRDFQNVTDVLGLIAERNFALDGSAPDDVIIDAHMMITGQASPNPNVGDWPADVWSTISQAKGQDGAFFVEDGVQRDLSELWTGVPDSDPGDGSYTSSGWNEGDIYLTGGVVHFIRGQTKNSTGGYRRHYSFDSRLLVTPPPFYPLTPDLEVIGWSDVASTYEP